MLISLYSIHFSLKKKHLFFYFSKKVRNFAFNNQYLYFLWTIIRRKVKCVRIKVQFF